MIAAELDAVILEASKAFDKSKKGHARSTTLSREYLSLQVRKAPEAIDREASASS